MGFGHRNCVVSGCANSGKKLNKWAKSQCELHKCARRSEECNCEPPFQLFPFPTALKSNERRVAWTLAVNRVDSKRKLWKPTKHSRVCGDHFVQGKPTGQHPDPELHLGYTRKEKCKRKAPTPRQETKAKRRKKKAVAGNAEKYDADVPQQSNIEAVFDESAETVATEQSLDAKETMISGRPPHITLDHCYCYGWESMDDPDFCTDEKCLSSRMEKDRELRELRELANNVKARLEKAEAKFEESKSKGLIYRDLNDSSIKLLTGIPNKKAFDAVYDTVKSNVKRMSYWSGPKKSKQKKRKFKTSPKKFGPQRKLTQKDEMLVTLMKLRLGSTNYDLGQRFGVSTALVSNVFTTWIKALASELSCLVYNPSIDVVKKTLPKKFRKPGYSNVRHIIDCTEIFIETPSTPSLRAATWSDYKQHNTAKVLVSVTPNGAFNFISKAWGGRTSDVHLTRESSFYNILEPYDEVMADRGFTIAEDLLLRKMKLHIPPGRRGQEQFTKADVKKTKTIANLRIIVEQAIRRLKTFRLLKFELPISLIANVDDIVIVCAAICNLYNPLWAM